MKRPTLHATAVLLLTTAPVFAGGLERAPQSLSALFEDGNYAEATFGYVDPKVSGSDVAGFDTRNVTDTYSFGGFAYKHQFTDNISGALIVEQPFGLDLAYPTDGSVVLGGTEATVDSTTYTGVLRYRADNNFGVHAGIRGSRASGSVELRGAGYGPLNSYRAELDSTWGTGWLAGVSYERPEIAARVSLTYQSHIDHDFDTVETIDPDGAGPIPRVTLADSETTVTTPRSWNLEGQTGIAPGTLLFGSIRWVNWSEFKVQPAYFSSLPGLSDGLVTLEDTTTYTLGVGRQINDTWSALGALTFEPRTDEPLSPLQPYNGRKGISVGAVYTQGPLKVTGIVSYVKLGSTDIGRRSEAGNVIYGETDDNHALGLGLKVGYTF